MDENDEGDEDDDDMNDVMNDPAFLQSVLESLPGVDPQSEEIRNAMGQLTGRKKDDKKSEKKDDSGDKKWRSMRCGVNDIGVTFWSSVFMLLDLYRVGQKLSSQGYWKRFF